MAFAARICATTSPSSAARDPQTLGPGAMTYRLRRLRLNGMIERLPNSYSYRVTQAGFRVALFFTRTYNRLLRPGLAAVLPGHGAASTPASQSFDTLETRIATYIAERTLA
jgi:hypothetical protein